MLQNVLVCPEGGPEHPSLTGLRVIRDLVLLEPAGRAASLVFPEGWGWLSTAGGGHHVIHSAAPGQVALTWLLKPASTAPSPGTGAHIPTGASSGRADLQTSLYSASVSSW